MGHCKARKQSPSTIYYCPTLFNLLNGIPVFYTLCSAFIKSILDSYHSIKLSETNLLCTELNIDQICVQSNVKVALKPYSDIYNGRYI